MARGPGGMWPQERPALGTMQGPGRKGQSRGALTVIELPGNQGTGWAGKEQVDCEAVYTDQAGCRGSAAGR